MCLCTCIGICTSGSEYIVNINIDVDFCHFVRYAYTCMCMCCSNSLILPFRVFREMLFGGVLKRKVKGKRYKPSSSTTEVLNFSGKHTVVIEEFDFDIFKQVIQFAHTGSLVLQARMLIGLVNAADHFEMPDLLEACMGFLDETISADSVCSMLSTVERYTRYFQTPSARNAVHKILEFVDSHADEVLGLRCLSTVPRPVMMLVLDREESHAAELLKFEAALRWCRQHHQNHPHIGLKTIFEPFSRLIEFHRIPANDLMQKVKPSGVVEDGVIVNALAYQADPLSVDPSLINDRVSRALSYSIYKSKMSPLQRKRSTSLTNLGQKIEMSEMSKEEIENNLSRASEYSQSHGAINIVFPGRTNGVAVLEGQTTPGDSMNGEVFETAVEVEEGWQGEGVGKSPRESKVRIITFGQNSPLLSDSTAHARRTISRTKSDGLVGCKVSSPIILNRPRRCTYSSSREDLSKDSYGSVGGLSQISSSEC